MAKSKEFSRVYGEYYIVIFVNETPKLYLWKLQAIFTYELTKKIFVQILLKRRDRIWEHTKGIVFS